MPEFNVGDRVSVGSLIVGRRPPVSEFPGRPATGTIEGFDTRGVFVMLDQPANGAEGCYATYSELEHVD